VTDDDDVVAGAGLVERADHRLGPDLGARVLFKGQVGRHRVVTVRLQLGYEQFPAPPAVRAAMDERKRGHDASFDVRTAER